MCPEHWEPPVPPDLRTDKQRLREGAVGPFGAGRAEGRGTTVGGAAALTVMRRQRPRPVADRRAAGHMRWWAIGAAAKGGGRALHFGAGGDDMWGGGGSATCDVHRKQRIGCGVVEVGLCRATRTGARGGPGRDGHMGRA